MAHSRPRCPPCQAYEALTRPGAASSSSARLEVYAPRFGSVCLEAALAALDVSRATVSAAAAAAPAGRRHARMLQAKAPSACGVAQTLPFVACAVRLSHTCAHAY